MCHWCWHRKRSLSDVIGSGLARGSATRDRKSIACGPDAPSMTLANRHPRLVTSEKVAFQVSQSSTAARTREAWLNHCCRVGDLGDVWKVLSFGELRADVLRQCGLHICQIVVASLGQRSELGRERVEALARRIVCVAQGPVGRGGAVDSKVTSAGEERIFFEGLQLDSTNNNNNSSSNDFSDLTRVQGTTL